MVTLAGSTFGPYHLKCRIEDRARHLRITVEREVSTPRTPHAHRRRPGGPQSIQEAMTMIGQETLVIPGTTIVTSDTKIGVKTMIGAEMTEIGTATEGTAAENVKGKDPDAQGHDHARSAWKLTETNVRSQLLVQGVLSHSPREQCRRTVPQAFPLHPYPHNHRPL